jgi:hypothetical protein
MVSGAADDRSVRLSHAAGMARIDRLHHPRVLGQPMHRADPATGEPAHPIAVYVVMFFTTGSFRLRLWRREALTRDHRWQTPPCRVRQHYDVTIASRSFHIV